MTRSAILTASIFGGASLLCCLALTLKPPVDTFSEEAPAVIELASPAPRSQGPRIFESTSSEAPTAGPTRCEREGNCVNIASSFEGFRLEEVCPFGSLQRTKRVIAGLEMACRFSRSTPGRCAMFCDMQTNHLSEAQHQEAAEQLLEHLRDTYGRELGHSIRVHPTTSVRRHRITFPYGRTETIQRSLLVETRWRYNPRGLGSPNIIKINYQGTLAPE